MGMIPFSELSAFIQQILSSVVPLVTFGKNSLRHRITKLLHIISEDSRNVLVVLVVIQIGPRVLKDHRYEKSLLCIPGDVCLRAVLTVTWEFARTGDTNLVDLEGIQATGVERETGFLGLIARPPVQVIEKHLGSFLSAIDVRELPDWAGRPDAATVLCWRGGSSPGIDR